MRTPIRGTCTELSTNRVDKELLFSKTTTWSRFVRNPAAMRCKLESTGWAVAGKGRSGDARSIARSTGVRHLALDWRDA